MVAVIGWWAKPNKFRYYLAYFGRHLKGIVCRYSALLYRKINNVLGCWSDKTRHLMFYRPQKNQYSWRWSHFSNQSVAHLRSLCWITRLKTASAVCKLIDILSNNEWLLLDLQKHRNGPLQEFNYPERKRITSCFSQCVRMDVPFVSDNFRSLYKI